MQRASFPLRNARSSAAAAHVGGEQLHLRFMVWAFIHSDMEGRGFQYVPARDPTLRSGTSFDTTSERNKTVLIRERLSVLRLIKSLLVL